MPSTFVTLEKRWSVTRAPAKIGTSMGRTTGVKVRCPRDCLWTFRCEDLEAGQVSRVGVYQPRGAVCSLKTSEYTPWRLANLSKSLRL